MEHKGGSQRGALARLRRIAPVRRLLGRAGGAMTAAIGMGLWLLVPAAASASAQTALSARSAAARPLTAASSTKTGPVAGMFSLGGSAAGAVARGADGHVYDNFGPTTGHSPWTEIDNSFVTTTTPAAAHTANGDLFVVARGIDGNLYMNANYQGGGWGGWVSMGFKTNLAPAAAASGNNVVVAATGTDGHAYYNFFTDGGGGAWHAVDTTQTSTTTPAVTLVGADDSYVFIAVRGTDGNLYLNQADVGPGFNGWIGWSSLGFATNLAPAGSSYTDHTASPDVEQSVLAAVGTDGHIYYNDWTLGGGGSGWIPVDTSFTTTAPAAIGLAGGSVDVLALGAQGKVYGNTASSLASPQWSGWAWEPFPAKRVAVGAGESGDQSVLAARDVNGTIWYDTWALSGSGTWTQAVNSYSLTPSMVGAPQATVVQDQNGQRVVIVALDHTGQVWLYDSSTSSWDSQSLPRTNNGTPAIVSVAGCPIMVTTNPDGHLYYQSVDGCSTYFNQSPIDTNFSSARAPAVTVVGANHDYMFVAARGTDGKLWLNQGGFANGGVTWIGWRSMGFATNYAPAGASSGNNSALVAVGTDGHVYYNYWTLGGGGSAWTPVDTTFTATGSAGASLVGSGNNYLFIAAPGYQHQLYLNQGALGGTFIGWGRA